MSCISYKTLTLTCPLPSSALPTAVSVPVVSESEFQSLPSYLRQMTLHNLNQAIHNINKFTAECPGQCYGSLTIKVNRLDVLFKWLKVLYDIFVLMDTSETQAGCHNENFILALLAEMSL